MMLNLLAGAKWNATVVAATNDGETQGAARPDHHHADRDEGDGADGCEDHDDGNDDGHDNIGKMGEADRTLVGLINHYDDEAHDGDRDDENYDDDDDDNTLEEQLPPPLLALLPSAPAALSLSSHI